MVDDFLKIYKNNETQQIIPFLKKLSPKDKKEIVKAMKPFVDTANQKGNKDIFYVAALVCCTKTQFRAYIEWFYGYVPDLADEVLEWYCPEWLSEYYNNRAESNWGILTYSALLRWLRKGYLYPSSALIGKSLANAPRKAANKGVCYDFTFVNDDPIILKEHIWTLFKTETYISYYDEKEKDEPVGWLKFFIDYTGNKIIDRIRVLRECLQIVTQDFKLGYVSWCTNLFVELKPTADELLLLQDELFATFDCRHTILPNKVLASIKTIASGPAFRVDDFISHLPVLFASDKKVILTSTLNILESAAKVHPDKRELICSELALVFFNKDESLQKKAAKIIVQYGNPASLSIKNALQTYADNILMSVKDILQAYLKEDNSSQIANEYQQEELVVIDESTAIKTIENVDDLIFFLSQVFDASEPYYYDLLPVALIKLNNQLDENSIGQLQIPFQKAYEIMLCQPFWHSLDYKTKAFQTTRFSWNVGLYKHLLAAFFVNYGLYLQKKYPVATRFIKEMHKEAEEHDKNKLRKAYDFIQYKLLIRPLTEWNGKKYAIYKSRHQIMLYALSLIEKGINIPLLSTPTHYPCWIDADILNERIKLYEKMGITPDNADRELALSRSYPLTYNRNLNSFYQQVTWQIPEEKEKDATWTMRPVLDISIRDNIRYCIGPLDVKQFILTYPSDPDVPFAQIVKDRFRFSQIPDAETRDFLTTSIAVLYDLKVELKEMASLFVACSMICSDKTIRNYAGEIWLERVGFDMIDSYQFGLILGKLLSAEWAPVKRLTDLISANLLNVSRKHNLALEEMLKAILLQIKKPVTNLKKLQSIYNELNALNKIE